MVIDTTKGYYEVIKNVKDALDIEVFQNKYFEEFFDAYQYIVGDTSSDVLRLKGFYINPDKANHYTSIPDYLNESCSFRCPYFILRRITKEEYDVLKEKYFKEPNKDLTIGEEKEFVLVKVPFDKENLSLDSTPKEKPNIVFNMEKINKIKKFELPLDLKEDAKSASNNNQGKNNQNRNSNNQNQSKSNNMNQNKNNNQNKNSQNRNTNNQNKNNQSKNTPNKSNNQNKSNNMNKNNNQNKNNQNKNSNNNRG